MLRIFRYFIYILFVTVIHLTTSALYAASPKKEETKIVEVEKVRLSNITQTIRLIGTIKAKRATTFIAKTHGVLNHHVIAGERIAKNTLIATLENPELEKSYLLSVDSEKIAKVQYERLLPLAKSQAISKQMLDEKKTQWIEAQKKLSQAKIELNGMGLSKLIFNLLPP